MQNVRSMDEPTFLPARIVGALFLVAAAGCDAAGPVLPIDVDYAVLEVNGEAMAIDLLERAISAELGEPFELPEVNTWWVTASCPDRNASGIWYRDACYAGLSFPICFEQYVTWAPRLSDTAYVHELMHCALFTAALNPDGGHHHEWWPIVGGIRAELRAAGY